MRKNLNNVISDFGDEWEKFDNETLSNKELKTYLIITLKFFLKSILQKIKLE